MAAEGLSAPKIAHNDSKECGGVMRAAPVGLFVDVIGGDDGVFQLGVDIAALTHGHPTGYLTAGYLAVLIAALAQGDALSAALARADAALSGKNDNEETIEALNAARRIAADGPPTPEARETLGGGWIAEEALAIGLACAMTAESFEACVLRSVIHSGDSDSTVAVAGNILGAVLGEAAIPQRWLDDLESHATVERIADDMMAVAADELTGEDAFAAYPGW
jgi:ADP-ribosylglycohydrolase